MAYEPIVDRIVQTKADGTVVRFIRGFINSDDPKPVTGIYDRSELYERDTGKWYLFNMGMGEWFVPDDNTGGGSGGGSGDVEADKVIASAYSTSGAYAAGSYVTKGGKLYKAKQTVSNEPWTAAHWEETKIMNEVGSIEPGTVLPDPSTGTNGMIVSVNNGEYVLANAPQGGGDSELPDASQATEGDVLTVHNGEWIASEPQGGGDSELPDASQATEGNVLTVHNNAWIASAPQGGEPELPDASQATEGNVLTVQNNAWVAAAPQAGGLSEDAADALLECLENLAWKDTNGGEYFSAFRVALKNLEVVSLSAVVNLGQGGVIWSDDELNTVKQYLEVTATYSNSTSEVVTAYSLSGTLDSATSTLTVTYGGFSTTVSVPVRIVGVTNYVSLTIKDRWFTTATSTGNFIFDYTAGSITLSGTPQTTANNWSAYIIDSKNTYWNTLKGKTIRVRYTLDSPTWVGAQSTTSPLNVCSVIVGCYTNGLSNSSGREKYATLFIGAIQDTITKEHVLTLNEQYTWANSGGNGTPSSTSRFGIGFYNATVNTWTVKDMQIVEVLN